MTDITEHENLLPNIKCGNFKRLKPYKSDPELEISDATMGEIYETRDGDVIYVCSYLTQGPNCVQTVSGFYVQSINGDYDPYFVDIKGISAESVWKDVVKYVASSKNEYENMLKEEEIRSAFQELKDIMINIVFVDKRSGDKYIVNDLLEIQARDGRPRVVVKSQRIKSGESTTLFISEYIEVFEQKLASGTYKTLTMRCEDGE